MRLISLSAQKFISDILNDALQNCKTRGGTVVTKKSPKDRMFYLKLDDLQPALSDYGISVKKPLYYN